MNGDRTTVDPAKLSTVHGVVLRQRAQELAASILVLNAAFSSLKKPNPDSKQLVFRAALLVLGISW